MNRPVRLVVNGQSRNIAAGSATLTALIMDLGLDPGMVVAEVNGDIVKRADFPTFSLSDSDKIELVRFVGGG